MFLQISAAFWVTLCYGIMYNVQKRQLIFCGCVGALGWLIYLISISLNYNKIISVFCSALVVSILSHLLAMKLKNPITLYQIPGIIPLVPGAGTYYTLYYLMRDNTQRSLLYFFETLQTAGAIAIAMLLVSSFVLFMTQLKQNR